MIEAEVLAFVRTEIERQLNIILVGASIDATGPRESIQAMFQGMPTITDRPVMHPYGYVSRAPQGTTQVVAKQGSSPQNRCILGHRDINRPALGAGEVVLYNQYGQQVRLENGAIRFGGTDSDQPIVLGTELKDFLTELITAISDLANAAASIGANAGAGLVTLGIPPIPGSPSQGCLDGGTDAASAGSAASDAGNNFVANDVILSDESFARKGGD